MKNFIKYFVICLFILVCIVLSSMISGQFIGEIMKDKFVEEARNAYPAGFTDKERDASVLVLVRTRQGGSGVSASSTTNVSGEVGENKLAIKEEMQVGIQSKVLDGTTTQTLFMSMPIADVAISVPSVRMMPVREMASVPEKVSAYKVFSSTVKKLRMMLETTMGMFTTGEIPAEKVSINKPQVEKEEVQVVLSSATVAAETSPISQDGEGETGITLPTGKEAWVGRKFKAEDGNWYIMGSLVCAEQVDPEAKPMYNAKTGEYIGYTVVKARALTPQETREREAILAKKAKPADTAKVTPKEEMKAEAEPNEEAKVPVVVKTKTEVKAPVVVAPPVVKEEKYIPTAQTVYIDNRTRQRILIVHEIADEDREDIEVSTGTIQPITYAGHPRIVLRVKVYSGWWLFSHVIFDSGIEVFNDGNSWLWYFEEKGGKIRMVKTGDLTQLPAK